jgi:hypothetical protein
MKPTYKNQLIEARRLLDEKGIQAVYNPHAMIGKTCGCGTCFCCAALQVYRENIGTTL